VAEGSAGTGRSQPWWSDALNDPWRSADAEAVVMSRAPAVPPPPDPRLELEPPGSRRRTGVLLAVVAVTGLLAGALGGGIGYVAATSARPAGAVLGAGPRGAEAPPTRTTGSVPAIVARVMPSVVTVEGVGAQGESLGSGFLLTADGYVLTNEHVVAEVPDRSVVVTFADATSLPARVVGRDPESDLAVVKVDKRGLRPVTLGDSDAVAVGDSVLAIGSPLALTGTVTEGIVSALDRTIETHDVGGVERYYAAIQTDAAVNRGNSGGPLFDLAGRVIGINSVIKSLSTDGQEAGNIGIAFAIPINQAARVASQIIDSGHARRTVIGAQVDKSDGPDGGVRLTRVDSGGPADSAGLRPGDVVLRLGSHPIVEPYDLIALVRRYDPGTVVTLVYRRDGATRTASVTLVADAK
jgi:putative serine protease PepD